MDSVSSVSSSMYMYGLPPAAPGSTSASQQPGVSPLDQSNLALEAQLSSTLLGSLGAPNGASGSSLPSSGSLFSTPDPSSLLASGTELSLLNAQGTAAMAYLTPSLPTPGQTFSGLA